MALFKSPIIAGASGSLAGITFSHNKGGQYLRARVVPTNPSTPQQEAVRIAVGVLSSRWVEVLSEAERAAWDLYALNVPLVNPLGDPINVTGLNMFIRSNAPAIQAAESIVDTAPAIFDLGSFTPPSFVAHASTDTVSVTFDNTDAWANEDSSIMTIFGSRPQNPSINYFKGPYRYLGKIEGNSTTPPVSPSVQDLAFPVELDQKMFFMVRVLRADARLSSSFRGNVLVTT